MSQDQQLTDRERRYVELAFARKDRLREHTRPIHTRFRVYSVLVYAAAEGGAERYVEGTNTEAVWMGQSVCAERSALGVLRVRDDYAASSTAATFPVTLVVVVSDAPVPLTPGLLCREFLCQFAHADARIVVASDAGVGAGAGAGAQHGCRYYPGYADALSAPSALTNGYIARVVSLRSLVPCPPLYLHQYAVGAGAGAGAGAVVSDYARKLAAAFALDDAAAAAAGLTARVEAGKAEEAASAAVDAIAWSSAARAVASTTTTTSTTIDWGSLYAAALSAARLDDAPHIAQHQLGAAALLLDPATGAARVASCSQRKLLEFGHSTDPAVSLHAHAHAGAGAGAGAGVKGCGCACAGEAAPVAAASAAVRKDAAGTGVRCVALVVVDAWGVPHPPSAQARAHWTEPMPATGATWGDALCLLTDARAAESADADAGAGAGVGGARLRVVAVRELNPDGADFTQEA